MTPWPAWLRLALVLPLVGLNAFVLKRLLVQFAPFPGLFLTAALIAFLLDLPCRWLMARGIGRSLSIAAVVLVSIGLLVFAVEQLDLPRLLEYRQELRVGRLLDLRGCLGVGQSALTKVSQVGHQAVAVEVGLALD